MTRPTGSAGSRSHSTVAARGQWAVEYARLSERDVGDLTSGELEALADSAWLLCHVDEAMTVRRQSFTAYADAGDHRAAARQAWRLFWECLYGGEHAVALGWLRRARRHLAGLTEVPEHGLLALADAELALNRGQLDEARRRATDALALGEQTSSPAVVALGLVLQGRIQHALGQLDEGSSALDEAMTFVLTGQLTDYFCGAVYCAVIAECRAVADLPRASEWTEAARAWCDTLPATTPFHGICRVHRGEVLGLLGRWAEAEAEIRAAAEELASGKPLSAASALCSLGEIRRWRGDLTGAEQAYLRAHQLGGDPQPGISLVWLAQGRVEAALAALRSGLVDDSRADEERAAFRWAQLEAALVTGGVDLARESAAELTSIAQRTRLPVPEARASHARGVAFLMEGSFPRALPELRDAQSRWASLSLPYEEAYARTCLGVARRHLGDEEGAALDIEAARSSLSRLDADPEPPTFLALLGVRFDRPAGLSPRETEVLRLVASGMTDREIADTLSISEHTVGRHLQNLFAKLGVSTRAAAAAYAVRCGLA